MFFCGQTWSSVSIFDIVVVSKILEICSETMLQQNLSQLCACDLPKDKHEGDEHSIPTKTDHFRVLSFCKPELWWFSLSTSFGPMGLYYHGPPRFSPFYGWSWISFIVWKRPALVKPSYLVAAFAAGQWQTLYYSWGNIIHDLTTSSMIWEGCRFFLDLWRIRFCQFLFTLLGQLMRGPAWTPQDWHLWIILTTVKSAVWNLTPPRLLLLEEQVRALFGVSLVRMCCTTKSHDFWEGLTANLWIRGAHCRWNDVDALEIIDLQRGDVRCLVSP